MRFLSHPVLRGTFFFGLLAAGGFAMADNPVPARYDEPLRPQFHFTPQKGWMNDPNGLVFYGGEYHLFFQHNPNGTDWVNELHWGHAVSRDLLHWKELPDAIHPLPMPGGRVAGAWSGSGFLDPGNTGGFRTGAESPIVVAWTATGLGQCIAYSSDRGRSFTPFSGNPVLPMAPDRHGDWDRDPKVYWNEDAGYWTMAISVTHKGVDFYSSPDLQHWTYRSTFPGLFECPDYFPLAVDGKEKRRKWVLWDASSRYYIGQFDGVRFTAESGPFVLDRGRNYYAAQTWNGVPDGRRISIAWMRDGKFPGMPFNQQMGFPSTLRLRTLPEGIRLTKMPVSELDKLHFDTRRWRGATLKLEENLLRGISGDALDVQAELEPETATALELRVHGEPVRFTKGTLSALGATAPLPLDHGRIRLRVLVDRTSLEVYGNDGAVSMTSALPPSPDNSLALTAAGGDAKVVSLTVSRVRSVWPR